MDFNPENVLLEITALLDTPAWPEESLPSPAEFGMAARNLPLAWWLEYFLRAGPEDFQEKFHLWPVRAQGVLGLEMGRCFLNRPLLARIYPAGKKPPPGNRWELARNGSLIRIIDSETGGNTRGIYYVFPHRLLWPEVIHRLDWTSFLNSEALDLLASEIALAARSRLTDVRSRADALRSLLVQPEAARQSIDPTQPESPTVEPLSASLEVFRPGAVPVKKPGRKKKKPSGQYRLFDEQTP
jgi:hypothetical protein